MALRLMLPLKNAAMEQAEAVDSRNRQPSVAGGWYSPFHITEA